MKVKELIEELQKISNSDAEIIIEQWVIEKRGQLVLNKSIVSDVVIFNGGLNAVVNLRTERIQKNMLVTLN